MNIRSDIKSPPTEAVPVSAVDAQDGNAAMGRWGSPSAPSAHRVPGVLIALIATHVALLAWSGYRHSPTLNEAGHLPAGLAVWRFGRFDLYCVNPPLFRMAAAVPLLFVDHAEDWSRYRENAAERPEWNVGTDFIRANGERSLWLFTLARWACIPFSVTGLYVCWRWGRRLFGERAGLAAAALWTFCPNILGHGALVTPDIPAVALGLLAAWTFACWLDEPGWPQALGAGLALGLALLSKTYWLSLFFVWPGLWLGQRVRRRGTRAPFVQLLTLLVLGLHVLNSGYLYVGTGTLLGDLPFYSRSLTGETLDPSRDPPGNPFRGTAWGTVPIPFPRDYLLGIDIQKRDFERRVWSYFLGEWRQQGWWHYYLVGLFVKVPVGTWALAALGAMAVARRPDRGDIVFHGAAIAVPAAVVFVTASLQTGLHQHVRYVFAVLPVLFLLGSQAFDPGTGVAARRRGIMAAFALCCLLTNGIGSLRAYPHSLSYFNEFIGGPERGADLLLHSNLDWGQDLIFVKEWIAAHPERRPVTVGAMPHFPLDAIGITAERTPTGPPPPGWHIVSVALIRDRRGYREQFASLEPIERVGGTMRVYYVGDRE